MKVLVIGGGMSGLTYGIVAVKNGIDVVIAERNDRVGKKIAMTGNGKCNIGNVNVSADLYNDKVFVQKIIDEVTVSEYVKFLDSCGIVTFSDSEGRLYPMSLNAPNVVDCLRYQFVKYGGIFVTGCNVTEYTVRDGKYYVNVDGNEMPFDKIVVACGSGSQVVKPDVGKLINDKFFTALSPSLTPVKVTNKPTVLNGQRCKAVVNLVADGNTVACERGEILFREYGLSGICIFNLSAIIARNNVNNIRHNYVFVVDVLPDLEENVISDIILQRINNNYDSDKLLYGLLPNVFNGYVLKHCNLDAKEIAHFIKNMTFEFSALCDYSMSQVTAGGVDIKYLTDDLTLPDGITVLGEIINVDGLCGGNNLYFASASALYAFTRQQRNVAYDKK